MQKYVLRIPEKLEPLVNLRIQEKRVDKLTALRELLYIGAEDYVMELYGKGYLSLSRAAELLGTSVYEVSRITQLKGIRTGATPDQQELSKKFAKRVTP